MSILALMRRFTIRLRMQGAIGAVLLLLGLLGGAGMWGMLRIHAVNQDFFVGPYAQSEHLAQVSGHLAQVRWAEKELLLQLTQHHALERAYADWQTSLQQLEQQARPHAELSAPIQAYAAALRPAMQAALASGQTGGDLSALLALAEKAAAPWGQAQQHLQALQQQVVQQAAQVQSQGEVLAQRSADAAREIKQLIQATVATVDGGVRHVEDTGGTMQTIVSGIERVAALVGSIATTAHEQASGIAQVHQAVGQIDQMTQQNATLVQESAAAADSLREQAQRLATVVGQFTLRDDADSGSARPLPWLPSR